MKLRRRTRTAAFFAGAIAYFGFGLPAGILVAQLGGTPGWPGAATGVVGVLAYRIIRAGYLRRAERRLAARGQKTVGRAAMRLAPDDLEILSREGMSHFDDNLEAYVTMSGTVLDLQPADYDRDAERRRKKREQTESEREEAITAFGTFAKAKTDSLYAAAIRQQQESIRADRELLEKLERNTAMEELHRATLEARFTEPSQTKTRSTIEIFGNVVYIDGKWAGAAGARDERFETPAYGSPAPAVEHLAQDGDELAAAILGERLRETVATARGRVVVLNQRQFDALAVKDPAVHYEILPDPQPAYPWWAAL